MPPHGDSADTELTGVLDRSALFDVLTEVEALGLNLLEVVQLTPRDEPPESGDPCTADPCTP
jgi:hypothetical protein